MHRRRDFLLHRSYLTKTLRILICVFYWLYFIRCLTSLFSIDHHLHLCSVFDGTSSSIHDVLSINPSTNVFVFGDFNDHHKDWLTYSCKADRPCEPCYNFSISNELTKMINFLTQIPEQDSYSPTLLNLFLSSDPWYLLYSGILSIGKLTFLCTQKGMPFFIKQLMIIHALIGAVCMIF